MAITLRNTKGTALTHVELDANFTTLQNADFDSAAVASIAQALDNSQSILDSAAVTTIAQAAQGNINLNTLAGDSDIDFGSKKILYSNNYDSIGALPSAGTYHGMFAHVHGEAKAYYAHGGAWIKLADYADIGTGIDSARTISLVDSNYVSARIGSVGGHTDVNMSGISNNQILKWDSAQQLFVAAADVSGGGGGGGLAYTDFSVSTNAAGSPALSYNNGTGVFSYTPPNLSSYLTSYTVSQGDVTAHQAALSITESQISDFGTYIAQGSSLDMNGAELIMDADGDTSFHANTDDEIDIRVKGSDVGKFDSDGLIINSIRTSTAGTPTLTSSSNINMSVGGSVTVSGGGFRVASLTGTQRNAMTAANGEIVYNSSTNKLQTYENNAWTDVISSGSTPGATFTLTANGASDYVFAADSRFFPTSANDPVLYLRRGDTYTFVNNSGGSHPFQIRQSNGGSAYNTGVTNNGASSGNIVFTVPMSAPSTLYYQCTNHSGMGNTINIV
tara:strand:+ start:3453 stop:4961 length:1509 start_codon:yes stop_codon:yes gene_type:complete